VPFLSKSTGSLSRLVDAVFTAQHRGGAGAPLVLLHGFTDTWRTWELVLPALEARHDVLAVSLAGHAGGPEIDGELTDDTLAISVERAMDDAGFATAHLVGNSLGGYTALRLAARGRARTVVALAPAGGWAEGDDSYQETLRHFLTTQDLVQAAAPHAERIACPVRFIWGTADRLLRWPSAAARFRAELPTADWVVLDGVGHCPQLDVPLETGQLILGFTAG
jgi:pimeloyl-ACP methyl ester carboxylesterase